MSDDILANELEAFRRWASNIRFLLSGIRHPTSLRNNASTAYQSIALEHCQTIYRLLSEQSITSAFALLRSQFDATLRGLWVRIGWTTGEFTAFMQGHLNMPSVGAIIDGLESRDPENFPPGELSSYKAQIYGDLCDLNHGGVYQLRAWMQADGIEPVYDAKDIVSVLRLAAHLSRLSCREILVIAQDIEGQSRLAAAFQSSYRDSRNA